MVSIPYTRKTFVWYNLSPKILDLSFDRVSLKYLWGVSYHMKFLRHERKTGNKKKLYTKKNCQLQYEEVESYWIMVRYYMLFAIFTLTSKWKHKQRNKQSTNTFSSNVFPYWQNPTKILLQWLVHRFGLKGAERIFQNFFLILKIIEGVAKISSIRECARSETVLTTKRLSIATGYGERTAFPTPP